MAGSEAEHPLPDLLPLEASALAVSPHPELLPPEASEALLLYHRAASVDLVRLRFLPLDLVLPVSVLLRRAVWGSELLRHRQVASVVSLVSAALLPHLSLDSARRLVSVALLLDPRLSLDSVRRLVSVALLLDSRLSLDSARRQVSAALLPDPRLSRDSARRQASVISEASVDLTGLAMLPLLVPLLHRRLVSVALLPDPRLSLDSVRRLTSASVLLRLRRLVRHRLRRVDSEVSPPAQLLFRRQESA